MGIDMPSNKAKVSHSALLEAADIAPEPTYVGAKAVRIGDSASKAALQRLAQAVTELKQQEIPKLLSDAIAAVRRGAPTVAKELALAALKLDEKQGIAWHILGISLEKIGDLGASLRSYDAALRLLPDETVIALDLGRLASRLDMPEFAAKLYSIHLQRDPSSLEAANNLATSLRDMRRFEEAIEILRPIIAQFPESGMLWNTLGTIVAQQGDTGTACVFYDEAIRLKPDFGLAFYNRSGCRAELGDIRGAFEDCESALAVTTVPTDIDNMRFSKALLQLAAGDLSGGWESYEARFLPGMTGAPSFIANAPRWEPANDLKGKRLVAFGEQGIGDEILFSHALPDVSEELGPDGHLTIVVERRLAPLFRRSFPQATVVTHKTARLEGRVTRGSLEIEDWSSIDYWSPVGTFLRKYRNDLESFGRRGPLLIAAPERVAHWKGWLESLPAGPKIGLLWKSAKIDGDRNRYFSPFEAWSDILKTPGAVFINTQYGDCEDEIRYAKQVLGVEIFQPPEIDLKEDLDDVAALVSALDVVLGSTNATMQLAGAVGTPIWMIASATTWTQLGADYYPWYPQARCFPLTSFLDWAPVVRQTADALNLAVKGDMAFAMNG
ncbi:tetratricopeptide repeat protein [Caulobacter sp. 73W]|uniref:Tetratricopeptide repeat protein n=1 Tax=Caulobacter sp. 73W TaxID=3161137 RepID=A0AB39KRR2_9CAUL